MYLSYYPRILSLSPNFKKEKKCISSIQGGMKKMKRKNTLNIAVCLLVSVVIFLSSTAVTANTEITPTAKDPQTTKIGSTYIQGIITSLRLENGGAMFSFRCILVHYYSRGIGVREYGTLSLFQRLIVPNDYQGILGNHLILARFPEYLSF